ncbi:MAG: tyrosine-type recombinase/integrase [Actinomycetia bacterium]|nr:tyrosine-type recombinase/integrase [Actinomycetes bacterium]
MGTSQPVPTGPGSTGHPAWFGEFLADRGTRKPSPHTLKAYRQDFDAIAGLLVGGDEPDVAQLRLSDITTESLRTAFAQYAETHAQSSIRRCWSTWKVLCEFLFTAELIPLNPMPRVGRPARAKSLPKALPADSVAALLAVLHADPGPSRKSDWTERDRAVILTSLLAGLRSEELLRANISDVRFTEDGAIMHVHGKGRKDRRIPIEAALIDAMERYLDTRAVKFPKATRRGCSPTGGFGAWPPAAPLFVGGDGQRLTRGALQYRVLAAFKRAGIDGDRAKGALVHGLRHTFATELANAKVSVYELMNLLGHESISTSQLYVEAAGQATRAAAAANPLYELVKRSARE